jgi:hypothetical protein
MFTFGSTINPSLGRQDFSAILQGGQAQAQAAQQAASIRAQSLAQLGQTVAQGIQTYAQNQEKKKQEAAATDMVAGIFKANPFLAKSFNLPTDQNGEFDKGALKEFIKVSGGPGQAVQLAQGLDQMNRAQQAQEEQRKAAQFAAFLQQGGGNLPSPVSSSAFTPEQQMAGRAAYTQQARQQAELAKTLAETAKIQLPTAKEAPAGYRYTPEGNLQMIPGGPAEVTATAAAEANRLARESAARQQKELDLRIEAAQAQAKTEADKKAAAEVAVKTAGEDAKLSAETTLREIAKAERLIESPLAQGFGSSIGGFFSGSAANDLETSYDVIRANEALGRIIALKKASPTGSTGFGALNLKELETLQSRFAKLSRSMSDKAAKESLEDLRSVIFRAFPDLKQQSEAKPATKGSRFQVISSS